MAKRSWAFPLFGALVGFCGGCGEPFNDRVGNGMSAGSGENTYGLTVCAKGPTVEGVDVYHGDGNIDWTKVKAAGIGFAFMKATEGTTFTDPNFAANWSGTAANGILRGAYHFFRPASDATMQADLFLSVAGVPKAGDLPLVMDLEATDNLPSATVAANALTFLQRIEAKSGRTPIIYSSRSFFNGTLGGPAGFSRYLLWDAHWGVNCPNLPDPTWANWAFWQYSSTATINGIAAGAVDVDRFNGTLADLQTLAQGMPAMVATTPPTQGNGNDAMTIVNWPDGHSELFATSPVGDLLHTANGATPGDDNWSMPAKLDGGATCGMAASFWGGQWIYPEVFSPLVTADTGHLWYVAGKGWNTFQPYGGAGLGLSHLSTVVWGNGATEVFALGGNGAIWHNAWSVAAKSWSGWSTLGGSFVTGASVLGYPDDHVELFATDGNGVAWHNLSAGGAWQGWTMLPGGGLASRPIPTRWDDGHAEVFARGIDGHLYRAVSDGKNNWQPFAVVSAATTIVGEPTAVLHSTRFNANPDGPEVFARDDKGAIVNTRWNGTAYPNFAALGAQTGASDPLAWVRSDGHIELFVVDKAGNLARSLHTAAGWSAWSSIGSGVSACFGVPAMIADGGIPPALDAGIVPTMDLASMPTSDGGAPPRLDAAATIHDAAATIHDDGPLAVADATPNATDHDLGAHWSKNTGGCSCSTGARTAPIPSAAWLSLSLALAVTWRRRRSG